MKVTALIVAWLLASWSVLVFVRQRVFPAALKYFSTGLDLAFLTAILLVSDGPRSPLIAGYFLVVLLSGLRFSLPLVRFATVGAMACYCCLLANARWTRIATRVPRYHELIFLLSVGVAGVLLGQIMRRARAAAEDYAARRESQAS